VDRLTRREVEEKVRMLNEDLERRGFGYRVALERAYGKYRLTVCRAEDFDKELQHCRVVAEEVSFDSLFDASQALRLIKALFGR